MAQTFSAQVDEWVMETKARLRAVFQLSTQYVIDDIVARTPVDTGFLRASLTVTLDSPLPIRPLARPAEGGLYQPEPYALQIAGADVEDTIYASFVAGYAGHVEYGARGRSGAGMVRLAAQAWPIHISRAVTEAKARVRSRTK